MYTLESKILKPEKTSLNFISMKLKQNKIHNEEAHKKYTWLNVSIQIHLVCILKTLTQKKIMIYCVKLPSRRVIAKINHEVLNV